jgi:hypothetical protein
MPTVARGLSELKGGVKKILFLNLDKDIFWFLVELKVEFKDSILCREKIPVEEGSFRKDEIWEL